MTLTYEEAFQVTLGGHVRYDPNNPARAEWRKRREQQIDWMAWASCERAAGRDPGPMPAEYETTVEMVRKAFDIR